MMTKYPYGHLAFHNKSGPNHTLLVCFREYGPMRFWFSFNDASFSFIIIVILDDMNQWLSNLAQSVVISLSLYQSTNWSTLQDSNDKKEPGEAFTTLSLRHIVSLLRAWHSAISRAKQAQT